MDFTGSTVRQPEVVDTAEDGEREEGEACDFRISRRPSKRHQSLFMVTPEEQARRVVRVLKRVTCPKVGFSKWDIFIRTETGRRGIRRILPFAGFAVTTLCARTRETGTRRSPL